MTAYIRALHWPVPAIGCLFLLGVSIHCSAELRDRVIVLDQNYASVREVHRINVQSGRQRLSFKNLPASLDPGSLELRARRGKVIVEEWRPIAARPIVSGTLPVWPLQAPAATSEAVTAWEVDCTSSTEGVVTMEFRYLFSNLTWSAHYDLGLRFTSNLQERVSCGVRAQVKIENRTQVTFSNTVLRLLQDIQSEQVELDSSPGNAPGFLSLDQDSPLADRWTKSVEDSGIRRSFRLPSRVDIEADQTHYFTLVDSNRSKATRLYRYRAGALAGADDAGHFRRMMRVHNTTANGLGWRLPSGPVDVFSSVTRRPLADSGFLHFTEVGDYVEIDLGPADELEAEILPDQRGSRREGQSEIHTRIRMHNHLPFEVPVQWEHDPDSSLHWRVLTSNASAEVQDGILLLSTRVPAEESRLLDFVLEFVQPAL